MPSDPDGQPAGRSGYGIAAVQTTLAVVAALVRLGPSPLTTIAQAAGCSTANAFRILQTLQINGLASQDHSRGPWRLGAKWLGIARAARRHDAIGITAAPVLKSLEYKCGEAVVLMMRDGEQSEVMAARHPPGASSGATAPGDRGFLHAGPGRLLLAYAPGEVLRGVLASRLPRLGPATRIEPMWILADLARIRARRWLVTQDEVADGIITLSTPVTDSAGAVNVVLSVVTSTIRMRTTRPQSLLPALAEAADTIGRLDELPLTGRDPVS